MQGYIPHICPSFGQEGRSGGQEVRLEVDGFLSSSYLPPISLSYQCPLWRHDFRRLKSEERHKQLLTQVGRPESKVDGVASSLLPCYQASTISILPAGGTRPAFSNPSPHSKGGEKHLHSM